ncbi:MAG: hypothetical protein HKN11_12315, partial [Rhizobiales bacterium]|nr:hypothetical protein [Hyphomicrobiales bacterium]
MAHCFVGLPKTQAGKISKTSLYRKKANGEMETFRHVLWGDWLELAPEDPLDPTPDGWVKIIWKPNSDNPETAYLKEAHKADSRPLEIIFVDVGQGDGAVMITPEPDDSEAVLVIDAGKHDHMLEFLHARFHTVRDDFQFTAAVITHPDEDHYGGFRDIFEAPRIGFDTVYQSGLVERPAGDKFAKLGGLTTDPATGILYIQTLATKRDDIEADFSDDTVFGQTRFPPVMFAALNNAKVKDFAMLS